MTSELNQMMHNRDYHHARAVKSKSEYHWSMYGSLRLKVNKMVKTCKSTSYENIIEKGKGNLGELWQTLNKITQHKGAIQLSFIQFNGIKVTDSESIANILNNHFTSIGSKLAAKFQFVVGNISNNPAVTDDYSLNKFVFTPISESFVYKRL